MSAAGGGGGGASSSPVNNTARITKSTSHQNVNEIGSKYYAVHKLSTISDQQVVSSSEEKSQISVVRKSYR